MEMLHKNGTSLEDYNYENIHIMDILRDQMADVDFMGMSVSFYMKYEICIYVNGSPYFDVEGDKKILLQINELFIFLMLSRPLFVAEN